MRLGSLPAHSEQDLRFVQDRIALFGKVTFFISTMFLVVTLTADLIRGVGRMEPKRYLTYSLIGGVAWAAGVTLLGFWLGQFAFVRANIELILILIVAISVLPIGVELVRARRTG